jgi:two-component system LytT family response regulator
VQAGEAHDGPSAIEAVRRLRPDVVFLDIQMPEPSGIEVVARLRELEVIPAVVFTTAFDHYAVTAFELEAVDYLLKPFGARRFLAAFERARQAVRSRATGATWIAPARPSPPQASQSPGSASSSETGASSSRWPCLPSSASRRRTTTR